MFKHKVTYILLFLVSFSSFSFAQSNGRHAFTEGMVKYELKVFGAPEIADFLRETQVVLYIKDGKTKIDLSVMGGFANVQLLSTEDTDLQTALMDIPMLPEKIAIPIDGESDLLDQVTGKTHRNQTPKELGEAIYDYKQKRRIARQKCFRAEMPVKGSQDRVVMYLSKRMKVDQESHLPNLFKDLEGFPLAFEINMDGVYFYLYAKEVHKGKIVDDHFEIPMDYSEKTIKEFKKEMETFFNGGKKEGVRL